MFLVRPLRMVSISLEHHLHRRPRHRQVELNPCKVIPLCTHPVLIIGSPASIRVRDANKYRRQRYSTSFRNVYDPPPNSHSLPRHPHLPRHHQDRCNLYYRGHLPHPRNAFPYRPYLSPSLTASGQIGFRRRQSTTYKLRNLPSMTGLERLCLMMATICWRMTPKGTMRKNQMILVLLVAAIQFCGQNGERVLRVPRLLTDTVHIDTPHVIVLHAWTRYFPGCYLRNRVLGHVTDVRVWRLYTLPRQFRCFSAWRLSLSHLGISNSHLRAQG